MEMNQILKPIIRVMDNMFFVRNAYVLVKHIAPFSIASLALLTLSVPADNLLAKFAALLKEPGSIYVPAILLTLGASVIYFFTIRSLSIRMYLWPRWDFLRTLFTSTISIAACTTMAYWVLQSTGSITNTYADKWACYLVAVLSLTGVGWSGLGNWVEAVGIKYPNYESGRLEAQKITDLLKSVRDQQIDSNQIDSKRNVIDFLKAARNLQNNITTNLDKEPEWARGKLKDASNYLRELIENVDKSFPLTNDRAVQDFAVVCKYKKQFEYSDVVNSLKSLNTFWHDWWCV